MGQTTWSDPQVVELTKKFVCVNIDPRNDPKGVGQQFGVRGVPDVRLLGPDGVEIQKLQGRSPQQVLQQLQSVLDSVKPATAARNWETDLIAAADQATQENKALAVLLVSDDSEGNDFTDFVQIADASDLLDNFICVKVVADDEFKKSDEYGWLKKFGATKPQCLLVVHGKKKLAKITKIVEPDKYVKDLTKAVEKYNKEVN
jgi:hypothetical protein